MNKTSFLLLCVCVTVIVFGQEDKSQSVVGKVVNIEGQAVPKARVVLYYIHTRWGMGNRIIEQTEAGTDGSFHFREPITTASLWPALVSGRTVWVIAPVPNLPFAIIFLYLTI
jgi:hypothetical protein